MRKLKILALSTFAIMAMVALSISVAGACDGAKKADAATASASGCSAKAAEAKTASASGCSAKAADAKTASASGCSAKAADAKVADAKVAGASCSASHAKTAMAEGHCTSAAAKVAGLSIETVRMPSGALAVFYNGQNDATVAALQAKAEMDPAEMGCDIAKCMSTNKECHVEVAKTAHGLMMLVTSPKAEVLDSYQERYAMEMASAATEDGASE